MLVGEHIFLRKMKLGDEDPILKWENDSTNWEHTDTKEPFTKKDILDFVTAPQDIEANLQLRLMICLNKTKTPVGCVDLFEYDHTIKQVGIGILIGEKQCLKKGYAKESLQLLTAYCKSSLKLKQLFCNISPQNLISIRLFENLGFEKVEKNKLFGIDVNYYELKL